MTRDDIIDIINSATRYNAMATSFPTPYQRSLMERMHRDGRPGSITEAEALALRPLENLVVVEEITPARSVQQHGHGIGAFLAAERRFLACLTSAGIRAIQPPPEPVPKRPARGRKPPVVKRKPKR
jgi:hypothetical protein